MPLGTRVDTDTYRTGYEWIGHSPTCNSNRCPSGVATQDPWLYRGLMVPEKARRVAQLHAKTVTPPPTLSPPRGCATPER